MNIESHEEQERVNAREEESKHEGGVSYRSATAQHAHRVCTANGCSEAPCSSVKTYLPRTSDTRALSPSLSLLDADCAAAANALNRPHRSETESGSTPGVEASVVETYLKQARGEND